MEKKIPESVYFSTARRIRPCDRSSEMYYAVRVRSELDSSLLSSS